MRVAVTVAVWWKGPVWGLKMVVIVAGVRIVPRRLYDSSADEASPVWVPAGRFLGGLIERARANAGAGSVAVTAVGDDDGGGG